MNKFLLVSFLITLSTVNNTYANENLVGIWASPSIKSAKVLWFFYPDGKVLASTNTSHNKHNVRWGATKNELTIISNPKTSSHKWIGSISGEIIKATHSFLFEGKIKASKWTAEKYSSNPNEKVNFFSLCSNTNYVWKVVNVGDFKECKGTVPWEKTTFFSYEEAKQECQSFIDKRKKKRTFKVEEKCE